MYIQNPEVAHFFGINSSPSTEKIQVFSRELAQYAQWKTDWVLLLWKEKTLYEYSLREVYKVYQRIEQEVMMILCTGLTKAKWSGNRNWINTQNDISNFNLNICLPVATSVSENLWDLQERISVVIANVLSNIAIDGDIGITYPFHYTLNWWKVAGHLVQKMNLNSEFDFLRIGIGINTAPVAPELPKNDDLAKYLFAKPTSIEILPNQWVNLATWLWKAIHASLSDTSKHEEYLQYLNIKKWDRITVYQDDGSIYFHGTLFSDKFRTIDPNGKIITNSHVVAYSNNHIKLVRP